MTCIVLVTTWGGTTYAWGSPTILTMIVAIFVLLFAFIYVEGRAAEPVIPLSLFRNRVFTVSSGVGFIVGFTLFGVITYLPQYQQVVRGASATASGLELFPLMGGLLIGSIGSGPDHQPKRALQAVSDRGLRSARRSACSCSPILASTPAC